MKTFPLALLSFALLCACSYHPKTPDRQLVAEPDSVDLMLADAADRATRALETLAAMEATQIPIKPVAMVPNAPIELQRSVTFDWTGPVEPLVEELTRKAGYNYGVLGSRPPVPLNVNIRAVNQPLINVFRDIGMQMGARGDLKLDANVRTIEIQYAEFGNKDM